MRWALITTVALSLTLYTGCKKDEEPSAENSEEQANSSEESEENNAPESEGEAEGEAEAATEAEAGTEAEGEAETEAATEEEAGTEAEGEATADAAVLTMPEGVIAIANVGSFDSVFNTVKTKATQYGFPLPITRNIVLEQLKGQLGLASMDWFATDKPIQAVILNPKVAGGNGVLLAPITGKDAVLAALPAAKETDVDGNDVALTIPGAGV